jgi:hypothetical protein
MQDVAGLRARKGLRGTISFYMEKAIQKAFKRERRF